ncbi:hypothetical protein ACFB49_08690 [Sphingomonas sp. DBB INV C78]|uniref:GcrA family cell cycle regulator n=1 Tax=Sphingomonas sp. DBB INV C78 TaxID=3349434 RepID=UPI0036D25151
MAWTDERIEQLRRLWEAGNTASQIAEELGGVSRNAVIGKAHRLGLQSRPSPVRGGDSSNSNSESTPKQAAPRPEPVAATPAPPPPAPAPAPAAAKPAAPAPVATPAPAAPATSAPQQVFRSIGPGGFQRQSPGEQQPPSTPAPPRRLVPAKPSADMAGKTSLLELSDKICKWPIGHPGEPDFHFCGQPINPGFPYCLNHCSVAYQAQLPRRDRRPPPPLPYGGPRVR